MAEYQIKRATLKPETLIDRINDGHLKPWSQVKIDGMSAIASDIPELTETFKAHGYVPAYRWDKWLGYPLMLASGAYAFLLFGGLRLANWDVEFAEFFVSYGYGLAALASLLVLIWTGLMITKSVKIGFVLSALLLAFNAYAFFSFAMMDVGLFTLVFFVLCLLRLSGLVPANWPEIEGTE